jgi:hypothetical protein
MTRKQTGNAQRKQKRTESKLHLILNPSGGIWKFAIWESYSPKLSYLTQNNGLDDVFQKRTAALPGQFQNGNLIYHRKTSSVYFLLATNLYLRIRYACIRFEAARSGISRIRHTHRAHLTRVSEKISQSA